MNWKIIKNEEIKQPLFEAMVESESKPDNWYAVDCDGTNWSCSCPQFTFRHKECKHIREAKERVVKYD